MKEINCENIRCSLCGLDSKVPGINLDKNGVCNICANWKPKTSVISKDMQMAASKLIETIKANGCKDSRSSYDVIVLYSGGKDSTYMLARLAKDTKLRVLAVTFDNWFLSEEVIKNQKKVLSMLGVDHFTIRPSWDNMRTLYYSSGKSLSLDEYKQFYSGFGVFCWPCFSLIYAHVCMLARNYRVNIIAGGWSPGQINAGGHSERKDGLIDFSEVMKIYVEPFDRLMKGIEDQTYVPFPSSADAEGIFLLPFFGFWPYEENEILKYVTESFEWKRPGDTDSCSSNCLINKLDRILYRKRFGYDRYEIQKANMARSGYITKEEVASTSCECLDLDSVYDIANSIGLEFELSLKERDK